MITAYHVTGSAIPRPASVRTIFADGSADESFRPGSDIELSHWVPNRTPPEWKADTSTEICLRFAAAGAPGGFDLAVNNHVDVDGVLSLFALMRAELALPHRGVLAQAARMGDFWGWGEPAAQALFQGLTLRQAELKAAKADLQAIYADGFVRATELLSAGPADPAVAPGLAALAASDARVAAGAIGRELVHERLALYRIPRALAEQDLGRALHIPAFNGPLDEAAWLLPASRARLDAQRVQLVAVEVAAGWHYDLYYPGYMWAETPESWRAPGFRFAGSTNGYYYGHAPLDAAVAALQAAERGPGAWTLARELSPFQGVAGRRFPVVLSVLDADGQPAPSRIPPGEVAAALAAAFQPAVAPAGAPLP